MNLPLCGRAGRIEKFNNKTLPAEVKCQCQAFFNLRVILFSDLGLNGRRKKTAIRDRPKLAFKGFFQPSALFSLRLFSNLTLI